MDILLQIYVAFISLEFVYTNRKIKYKYRRQTYTAKNVIGTWIVIGTKP